MESANYSKLRLLCPTTWTVRAKALHSIHNNYKPIQEWLTWSEDSKNNSDPDSHARASGLLKRMKSFNFMYGLKLSMMILDHTDNLSATLQTTNLCAADAQETATLVVDTITRMENEQDATLFYEMVKIRVDQFSLEEPSLQRKRKLPNRVNFLHDYKESASHYHENGNYFYPAQYFAAIVNVTKTIKNRFNQPDYPMSIHIEKTALKGPVGLDVDQHINILQMIYKDEFDYIQLKSQLFTLSYYLHA